MTSTLDTSPGKPGQSPSGKSGTPKDKGKLYNDADIAKIKSDAAAMGQGRAEKVAEQGKEALTQELQSTKTRLDALERQVDESRLAEARGDPAQLQILQREQTVTKREKDAEATVVDVARREAQLKTDLDALATNQGVVAIATLAAKHGLETEELESLGISDPIALEKVAVKLAAAKPKGPEGGEGGEGEGEFTPDEGEGGGGGAKPLTTEGVAEMSTSAVEAALKKADETK